MNRAVSMYAILSLFLLGVPSTAQTAADEAWVARCDAGDSYLGRSSSVAERKYSADGINWVLRFSNAFLSVGRSYEFAMRSEDARAEGRKFYLCPDEKNCFNVPVESRGGGKYSATFALYSPEDSEYMAKIREQGLFVLDGRIVQINLQEALDANSKQCG